jgi:hypothetical protein
MNFLRFIVTFRLRFDSTMLSEDNTINSSRIKWGKRVTQINMVTAKAKLTAPVTCSLAT